MYVHVCVISLGNNIIELRKPLLSQTCFFTKHEIINITIKDVMVHSFLMMTFSYSRRLHNLKKEQT